MDARNELSDTKGLGQIVVGSGIESVQNVGEGDVDLVKYRWRDGRLGVQFGLEKGQPGWRLVLFGEKGKLDIPVADADTFYWNLNRRFLEMVRTGRQPLLNQEMLEVIRALCLAKKSKVEGGTALRLRCLMALADSARGCSRTA